MSYIAIRPLAPARNPFALVPDPKKKYSPVYDRLLDIVVVDSVIEKTGVVVVPKHANNLCDMLPDVFLMPRGVP